jgi:hypothetical protein
MNPENLPTNFRSRDSDFTTIQYRALLKIASSKYLFTSADDMGPLLGRRILWRHDVDYSLNRAAKLAEIEREERVRAHYFLNIRSDFFSVAEASQVALVEKIVELGHFVGLHFDAGYHGINREIALSEVIQDEAILFERLLGLRPTAFSFHNPSAFHLTCDADSYGGLVNCYSKRFQTEVGYCSDSNGYWRFRRLYDVLADATDPCLQVLTHPGWWQEKPMPPRHRIFRSVYGRAASTLRAYDANLELHGRTNHAGATARLGFLKTRHSRLFELCDYLWSSCHYESLFVELWRLHETQLNKLCKAELRKRWRVPTVEVNAFFESTSLAIDGVLLLAGVFGRTWQDATGLDRSEYQAWFKILKTLIHGRSSGPSQRLQDGCVFLCSAIESLSSWGKAHPIQYDGIDHLGSIGIPTSKTADGSLTDRLEEVADDINDFPLKKWEQFKADILKVCAAGTAQASLL